jgi:hypothetical protein
VLWREEELVRDGLERGAGLAGRPELAGAADKPPPEEVGAAAAEANGLGLPLLLDAVALVALAETSTSVIAPVGAAGSALAAGRCAGVNLRGFTPTNGTINILKWRRID